MTKKILALLILCISPSVFPKNVGGDQDGFVYKKINENMVFYCLQEVSLNYKKTSIAFDAYRKRISHKPFDNFNKLKLVKTEIFDEPSSAFTDTYYEYSNGKKIAIFSITHKGDEFWSATYKSVGSKEKLDLDEVIYNLKNINAICHSAINLFQD